MRVERQHVKTKEPHEEKRDGCASTESRKVHNQRKLMKFVSSIHQPYKRERKNYINCVDFVLPLKFVVSLWLGQWMFMHQPDEKGCGCINGLILNEISGRNLANCLIVSLFFFHSLENFLILVCLIYRIWVLLCFFDILNWKPRQIFRLEHSNHGQLMCYLLFSKSRFSC